MSKQQKSPPPGSKGDGGQKPPTPGNPTRQRHQMGVPKGKGK